MPPTVRRNIATAGRDSRERAHRRAAFTLLEVTLAAVMAGLVVASLATLFVSVDRGGELLRRRTAESAELQRLRVVMSRTFASLLTEQRPVTPGRPTSATPDPLESRPPRLWLREDPALSGVTLARPEADGTSTTVRPQMLEVVLVDAPLATVQRDAFAVAAQIGQRAGAAARAARTGGSERVIDVGGGVLVSGGRRNEQQPAGQPAPSTPGDASAGANTTDPTATGDDSVRAVRGSFELREMPTTARASDDTPRAYALYWVPRRLEGGDEDWRSVRADEGPDGTRLESPPVGSRPVLVAEGLSFVRWRLFDDRQRKLEHRVVAFNDLPAYVEMDVRTVSGLEVSWLFEVSWATGPERAPARQTAGAPTPPTPPTAPTPLTPATAPTAPGGAGTGTGAGRREGERPREGERRRDGSAPRERGRP